MNWGVSSKTMESDLTLDMLVSGTTEQARISTIIIDEDSTIMTKLKSVPHEVTKKSDINHAKKLYEIIYMPYRKSIASFHLKPFTVFKNIFHMQLSSTRMARYSQRQVFKM